MGRVPIVLVLIPVIMVAGCMSNSPQESTFIPGNSSGGSSSHLNASVGSAEINGTFSGWLTAPMDVFDEVEMFLNSMNVTLYAFTVEVLGVKTNASVAIYVLKLSPSFVPRDFNITINGRRINGTTCVPYSDKLFVEIEERRNRGRLGTGAYLVLNNVSTVKATARVSIGSLNNVTEKTLLTLTEPHGEKVSLIVRVVRPDDYVFTVLCNGTEVSSSGLEVG